MPSLVTIPRLLCMKSPSTDGPKENFEICADFEPDIPNWPVRTTSPSARAASKPQIFWWCVAVGVKPVPLSRVWDSVISYCCKNRW
jgi:hypothetical protein